MSGQSGATVATPLLKAGDPSWPRALDRLQALERQHEPTPGARIPRAEARQCEEPALVEPLPGLNQPPFASHAHPIAARTSCSFSTAWNPFAAQELRRGPWAHVFNQL
jgi:hypothetical protein